ncbi:MAG: CRISPR-associated helicase Cas3', partial [Micrococcales bacterium]|nr:CRISPR-associated helicase Cas3' [Micrococcales bacterium]
MDFDIGRAVSVVWAKSYPFNAAVECWLPVWQHLDDTADIAGLLWDEWLAASARTSVARALPGGEDDARRLLTWLAGVHDVGKASPAFAVQVGELANRMVRAGLAIGSTVQQDRSHLRHEIVGAAALDQWLRGHGCLDKYARRQLTEVVAGHHGAFPMLSSVQEAPENQRLMGAGRWDAVRGVLLDRSAARAGVADALDGWTDLKLPQAVQMTLTGLVVMADWIASSEAFGLLPVDEVPPIPVPAPGPSDRALAAWRHVDLGRCWVPRLVPTEVEARFAERFSWAPRPIQRRAAELAEAMVAPGLMIIEAPMGVGKTEAAFMAVETSAQRTGATGCFVALPTQATSNAMFTRMLDWLEHLPDHDGVGGQSVSLVHGKAALNDDFRRLRPLPRQGAPMYDDDAGELASARTADRIRAGLSEWARGRKRAALASFVVGTIDQVLFDALNARHVMLRQLSLAGKVVVIDEVHAADVYMSTFLDRALEWLAGAGVPVVLMSATLPAGRRAELYTAYERGRRLRLGGVLDEPERDAIAQRLDGDIGYPCLITTGEDGPRVTTVGQPDGSEAWLHRLDDSDDALVGLLSEALRDGGCAVVVRNTVRRAQATATYLAERLADTQVTVAHAQFLAADRAEKDADLLRAFGPPGPRTARPHRHVVVATQVVEQSLDVDFDLMVTDIAPVDLVLQRIGRLHRHVRDNRPASLRAPHCYVTGVGWDEVPPRLDGGSVRVYQKWPLLRSLAALGSRLDGEPLRLPADIAPMVQAAYAADTPAPDGWATAIDAAWDSYRRTEAERQQNAETFALPRLADNGRDLYDLSHFAAGKVDEDSPQGQGMVRDGGNSIEVIV